MSTQGFFKAQNAPKSVFCRGSRWASLRRSSRPPRHPLFIPLPSTPSAFRSFRLPLASDPYRLFPTLRIAWLVRAVANKYAFQQTDEHTNSQKDINIANVREDGQTDERTDTAWRHRPRLHSIARQISNNAFLQKSCLQTDGHTTDNKGACSNIVFAILATRLFRRACSGVLVEYRTRNREVAGSTHTRSTASNLEQVANLLCAQANSASYPQRDGK